MLAGLNSSISRARFTFGIWTFSSTALFQTLAHRFDTIVGGAKLVHLAIAQDVKRLQRESHEGKSVNVPVVPGADRLAEGVLDDLAPRRPGLWLAA